MARGTRRKRWVSRWAKLGALALALCAPAGAAWVVTAEAARVDPDLKTPPKGTRVDVHADKIAYDARSRIAVATGKVVITYGRYQLTATRVSYDQRRDRMTANGSVVLKEPGGNILEADTAQLEDRFREGFAEHLRLLLTNDAVVTADYATRTQGTITVYEHVTYTRCRTCVSEDGTPAWQIRSREVTHDENDHTIYHRDATFEFGGVPVFWLPYLSHPDPTVKRRSGFLIPSVSYGDTYGAGVEIPYFINLAPNYDLTLRPFITSGQGPLIRAEWRHRLRDGRYYIDGGGIYQFDKNEPPPGDRRWRGFVRSEGEFDLGDDWTYGWDGTLVGDKTFLRRYDIDDRDEAVSRVYLTNLDDRSYFQAEAIHFRTLLTAEDQDDLPVALPYMRHSFTFGDPVFGGELGIDTSVYSLSREDNLSPFTGVNLATDQSRFTTDVHWQRQMVSDAGLLITPFAAVRGDLYMADNLPDPLVPGGERDTDTTARVLPKAGVDIRFPLISGGEFGQHVLTPVGQVVAALDEPDEDRIGNEDAITLNFDHTSLFLSDRFTGLDRYEGGVRVNAGLAYTFLAANGGFLRASLGESFHVAGENSFVADSGLDGTSSDLVAAIALQPNDFIRFTAQTRVEEDFSDVNVFEAGVSLTFDRISGSVNYASLDAEPAYGRPTDQEQIWGEASYNFSGGWSVFGGLRYDVDNDRMLRTMAGIGYDCDCMNFKLAWIEDNVGDGDAEEGTTVKLTLELKTLGTAKIGGGL